MKKQQLETKDLIISAATKVFAAKGFKGATIRDICSAANQSVGSVNYHFRDKDGLYEAVTRKILEDLILKYEPEPENSAALPPEKKLRIFIKTYLMRFSTLTNDSDNGVRGMFMLREIMNPSPSFKKYFTAFQSKQIDYLLHIIADLTGKPSTSPDVMRSAISIVAQCFQFVFGRKIFGLLGVEGGNAQEISICVEHIEKFSIGGINAVAGVNR